jgi:SAM-dependent methyltransferase
MRQTVEESTDSSSTVRVDHPRELNGAVGEIHCVHPENCLHEGTATRIITPQERWSYAALIPLSIPPSAEGEMWVRVRTAVLWGEGGFGLLNRAGTAFQDRAFVGAGPHVRAIYLHVKDAADLDSLVIENASSDGKSSEILLEEVAVLIEGSVQDGACGAVWPFSPGVEGKALLRDSFDLLRKKWGEVPATETARIMSADLQRMSDVELLAAWDDFHRKSVGGDSFSARGWYELLYSDVFRGRKVLDFGCGLGITTIPYAASGAAVTFVDLVQSNVEVVRRVCQLKGLENVRFCYMEDLGSLATLAPDYDFIYSCGSMINAPLEVVRLEAQELLKHLKVGGRWIELAYPKSRWEQEGRMPFDRWGERTDGGAPWMEWHDLQKLKDYLAPAVFEVVMELEFHCGAFNWFDLIRRS